MDGGKILKTLEFDHLPEQRTSWDLHLRLRAAPELETPALQRAQ